MQNNIKILDSAYLQWVEQVSTRYRTGQIKAAVQINQEQLRFYWDLGRDIVEMHVEERWGDKVIKNLSIDLQRVLPDAQGLSRTNIYYSKKFYQLYSRTLETIPQPVGQLEKHVSGQMEIVPQVEG